MLYSIQAYRGAAVLLVVLFHGNDLVRRKYGLPPFLDIFSAGFSGVHLFFVLSGFIILRAHIRDVGVPRRLHWYLKRRIVRIYPVYWIVFLLLGGWQLISIHIDMRDFALNAFLFSSTKQLVIPVSWTLLYELTFYGAFAVLVISRNIGIGVIAIWLFAILAAWGNTSYHFLQPFNLLFILGLGASVFVVELKGIHSYQSDVISGISAGVGVLVFLATAVYYSTLHVNAEAWPEHPVTILGFGSASALLVIGSASTRIEHFFERRYLLGLIGNASYSIYLIHLWAEKAAYKLIRYAWPEAGEGLGKSQIFSALLLIIITTAAVLAGIFLHSRVERPLLRFLRERVGSASTK